MCKLESLHTNFLSGSLIFPSQLHLGMNISELNILKHLEYTFFCFRESETVIFVMSIFRFLSSSNNFLSYIL